MVVLLWTFGIVKCFIIDICDCETRRAHFNVMVTSAEMLDPRFELSTRHFKQKKESIISSVFPISLQIMCNFNISAKNIYIYICCLARENTGACIVLQIMLSCAGFCLTSVLIKLCVMHGGGSRAQPPSAGVDSLVYGDTFYTHTRCFYVVFVSVSVWINSR